MCFREEDFVVVYEDPFLLIMVVRNPLFSFCCVSAHAPHCTLRQEAREERWKLLKGIRNLIPPSARMLPLVVGIDANATLGVALEDRVGEVGAEEPNDNTPGFC